MGEVRAGVKMAGRQAAGEASPLGCVKLAAEGAAMEGVTICLATEQDVEGVLDLQKRWQAEQITYAHEPNAREFVLGRLGPLFLIAEAEACFVAFAYGAVHQSSGLAVTPAGQRYLEVDDIYVAAEHRGRGIGGELLDGLIEAARREGVERVHVFSATKDHDQVLRFYRRHGFQPWGVQLYK